MRKYILAMISPRVSCELALNQTMLTAVAVNAINGALMATIYLLPLLNILSLQLMLLTAVLFGPFVSLIISSVYSGIEFWTGQKMGGKASFADLYRIFAWSFLPVGFAGITTWLIFSLAFVNSRNTIPLIIYAPFLIIFCFAIIIYCSNVMAIQRFSKTKAAVSMLISFIIFIFIPSWIVLVFAGIKNIAMKFCSKYCRNNDNRNEIASTGVGRVAIVLVLFYTALFSWIVLYDEKPHPLVSKALATPLPDIFQPDNAWLAFLGFTSPEGGPPFIKEEEMLRTIKAAMLKDDEKALSEGEFTKQNKARLSFRGELPDIYSKKDNGLWEYVAQHKTGVDQLLRDNKELLERYGKLYSYDQYVEPLDYGLYAPVPSFLPIVKIQKLKLMQMARVAKQGNLHDALIAVQKDAEFWRFIGRSSKTLIAKLVSISILSSDIKFVAELGAHYHLTVKEWQAVQAILKPFDHGEASLKATLHGEACINMLGIEYIFRGVNKDPFMVSLLLKPNATRSRMYSSLQKGIDLSAMTPQKFASEVAREKPVNHLITDYSFIYNPAGVILASIAEPNTSAYIEKGHNLEGLRRLAILIVLAKIENIAPKNMQQFLDAHKGDYGNPYTGAPMNWNGQKKTIGFKHLHDDKSVEVFL
jgi:hypothetical protein